MEFYKIIGKRGHQGQGRTTEVPIYIKSDDICHAIKRYNNLRGFHPTGMSTAKNHKKRYGGKYNPCFLPNIIKLSEKDAEELGLEKLINKDGVWVSDEN